jgi:hypothetical protein
VDLGGERYEIENIDPYSSESLLTDSYARSSERLDRL